MAVERVQNTAVQQDTLSFSLMGVSGVGKSRAVKKLQEALGEDVSIYSVDVEIWNGNSPLRDDFVHYAREHHVDSTVSASNLGETARYFGVLGEVSEEEFRYKMALHVDAERAAVAAAPAWLEQQQGHKGVDTSGSFCEAANPADPHDPLINAIANATKVLYIEPTREHLDLLAQRQATNPKPLYYRPEFLDYHIPRMLNAYGVRSLSQLDARQVNAYLYPRLMEVRLDRYSAIVNIMGDRAITLDMTTSRALEPNELVDLLRP